ncbi:Hint domain-containing protein [Ancylobacter defluvii]|uniref:Hedgehog/Intein (Hint) domain-containing protein n=1 Tax=Ancylobacter defluvii TaxID=1282440 RepID=A0A9W6JRI4_9HYPH|nr:Hint domain-containing protein [Ancylobacter defluvii]MBS7587631.1 Hint domain-containing protein [Ancylobacter defluvii]GLK82441.1 hypothetical protein GCM10017653_05100 [Ancylobacter defluvii]
MAIIGVNLLDSDQTVSEATGFEPGDTVSITALGDHTLTIDGVTTTVSYGVGLSAVSNVTIAAVNDANVTIDNGLLSVGLISSLNYTVGDTSDITVQSGTVALGVGTSQSVTFSGSGSGTFFYDDNTILGSSTSFNVYDFSTGDAIGATGIAFSGFAYDSGTDIGTFTFSGGFPADTVIFNVQGMTDADAAAILAGPPSAFISGGAFVNPVCFVRGTLIDTPEGPVAIENLKAGDKVIGRSGVREVKWIGWRDYGSSWLRTADQKLRVAPVRIHAGAFADNVPSSDLVVSPWHHLFVSGKLVRANDLVNGVTIVQELDTRSVSYWHVELDQFDVVRAHGMFSEAWADGGNRDFFQNVDVTTLRPEDSKRRKADRPGFEALRDEKRIRAIHDKVAARARQIAKVDAPAKSVSAA